MLTGQPELLATLSAAAIRVIWPSSDSSDIALRAVNPRTIMVGCVRIIRAVTAATRRERERARDGKKAGRQVGGRQVLP